MVKYRRLTQNELEELEKDFVSFLAAQSIVADDWIKIKEEDQSRMNELIDQFSDIVLEKILSTIEYLEMLSEMEIKVFKTDERKARMVGLKINSDALDLRNEEDLKSLFNSADELKKHGCELFEMEKEYSKTKAEEVYFLIKNGAMICDDSYYKLIDALLKA